MAEQWKPIPGFCGLYEISNLGEVRSWRIHGGRHLPGERALEPHILKPTLRKRRSGQKILEISLWDGEKNSFPMNVKKSCARHLVGRPSPGKGSCSSRWRSDQLCGSQPKIRPPDRSQQNQGHVQTKARGEMHDGRRGGRCLPFYLGSGKEKLSFLSGSLQSHQKKNRVRWFLF